MPVSGFASTGCLIVFMQMAAPGVFCVGVIYSIWGTVWRRFVRRTLAPPTHTTSCTRRVHTSLALLAARMARSCSCCQRLSWCRGRRNRPALWQRSPDVRQHRAAANEAQQVTEDWDESSSGILLGKKWGYRPVTCRVSMLLLSLLLLWLSWLS